MPQFSYKARDSKGALVEGTMDAAAQTMVVSRLQQLGYFPLKISSPEAAAPAPLSTTTNAKAPEAQLSLSIGRRRIRTSDIVGFNRQLADLLIAGVPLVKALSILSRQMQSADFRAIMESILNDVQSGRTFGDSLMQHPKVFSKLYVAMVRAGEAGGMLDSVLGRLAEFSEAEEQVKGRVRAALAYPAFLICAGTSALFVLFVWILPRIVDTFRQLEQGLPPLTQFLITISDFLSHYWIAVLGGIAGAIVFVWRFLHTAAGRTMADRLLLKTPVVRDIIRKREAAQFARTLGSLLKNGVSILSALDITREVASTSVFRAEIARISEEITQGSSIAQPLRDSVIIPPVAVSMIAVGEETGRLSEVLLRISDSFEAEVDRLVRTLTSLLEPLIIVGMGLIVAFIVISILLPLFTIDPSGGM